MERLSPQDLITMWPDEIGWLQDIGALAVLDGRPLAGVDGTVRVDAVRAMVKGRLHMAPRLRQVVYTPPLGLGRPLWVDASRFDIDRHVKVRPVPAPGDETQLLAAVEELRRRRLDPSRPMWEMWLLPGLSDGRLGLYLRVHHAIADGPATVMLLAAFFDIAPDVAATAEQPWTPTDPPPARDLLIDNLRRSGDALGRAVAATAHPAVLAHRARKVGTGVRRAVTSSRAPRTSLNRPIGADRRLAVVRSDLDLLKVTARDCGATVNDVLLAAVAGGLREVLRSRGEPVDNLALQAIVPIALPHRREERQQGNVLGQMLVPLPVGVAEPDRRLQLIAARTARCKKGAGPRRLPVLRGRTLQRAALYLAAHQRVANVYVANVPGPETQLHLAGAPVLEVFPVVPLLGNFTLGVGALSYAGQLTVMAIGDRAACPDLDAFALAVDASLQSFTTLGR